MTDGGLRALAGVLDAMRDCPKDERGIVLDRARDHAVPFVARGVEAQDENALVVEPLVVRIELDEGVIANAVTRGIARAFLPRRSST